MYQPTLKELAEAMIDREDTRAEVLKYLSGGQGFRELGFALDRIMDKVEENWASVDTRNTYSTERDKDYG